MKYDVHLHSPMTESDKQTTKGDISRPVSFRRKSKRASHSGHTYILTKLHIEASETAAVTGQTTKTELCFAIRRAIDSSIRELFGDLSGAAVLTYGLLSVQADTCSHHLACWSLVLAVHTSYAGHLSTALSLLSTSSGGSAVAGLVLGGGKEENEKPTAVYADVLQTADLLLDLALPRSLSTLNDLVSTGHR